MMRVTIDEGLCKGHAVCMGEAPEVFKVSRSGELTLLLENPPEAMRDKVEAAVKYCPTGAISLQES
jgi:ferredoxin